MFIKSRFLFIFIFTNIFTKSSQGLGVIQDQHTHQLAASSAAHKHQHAVNDSAAQSTTHNATHKRQHAANDSAAQSTINNATHKRQHAANDSAAQSTFNNAAHKRQHAASNAAHIIKPTTNTSISLTPKSTNNTLIIYYSLSNTGNAYKLALLWEKTLTQTKTLPSHFYRMRILPVQKYQLTGPFDNTFLGKIKASYYSLFSIETSQNLLDLSPFNRIILCAPIWLGSIASPMQSFIKIHKQQLQSKQVFLSLSYDHSSPTTINHAVKFINKKHGFKFKFISSAHKTRIYSHF